MFCERQAALIHVERLWLDNRYTIEGSHLHRRVDESGPRREVRADLVVVRGLRLRSFSLGVVGRADVVEFRRPLVVGTSELGGELQPVGCSLRNLPGLWLPFPVDYKRGRPKADRCDEIQLCAQALCLEEMLGTVVLEGALFYGKNRRRKGVIFNSALRESTVSVARRFRQLVAEQRTPRPPAGARCEACSLEPLCMPGRAGAGHSVKDYLRRMIGEQAGATGVAP